MSLDFFVTQFYRLVVHDIVLMSDVYWFYSQNRTEGKSIQEFSELLSNLLEIESQNFEEINTAKLSIGEGEGVLLIIWDYFHDVFIKHLLDDASQFPFWASKLIVTSQPVQFGMPVIRAYWACLKNVYFTRGVRGMFEGCLPYMFASCYHNHRFLTKVTLAFISNVFAKIPHPGSLPPVDEDLTSPLSSPNGKAKKTYPKESAYPKDSLKLSHHASHSTDLPATAASGSTNSGGGASDSVSAPTMFKHKTRSNADLSTLMGGNSGVSSTIASNGVSGTNANATHNMPVAATTALPFKSSNNNKHATNSTTHSNTTTGSYALGTAGTAGAPKGFVNINNNGVLGYPTNRVAGSEHYSSVSTIRPKKHSTPPTTDTMIMRQLQKACVAFMTHPLMVLSAAMVKNPVYQGHTAVVAFFKMWSNTGIAGLYQGFRSRFVLSLIPLSPVVLLGVADAIIYRRMNGQGTLDSTGGVLSTLKYIVTESTTSISSTVSSAITDSSSGSGGSGGSGSVMSLFNYGLLTAVHVVPGFLSFVAMRSLAWVVMGSSLNRKHQISRRKEIVDAHISLIDKKSPYE